MVCFVCSECGKTWYTSNTKAGQTCEKCNGKLIEKNDKLKVNSENKKRN